MRVICGGVVGLVFTVELLEPNWTFVPSPIIYRLRTKNSVSVFVIFVQLLNERIKLSDIKFN